MEGKSKGFVLIGFQASGKTTLGKQLAHAIQYSFIDTDQKIEQCHSPLSCREIFKQFGSSYFRSLETQMIHSINSSSLSIIATGGGSLLQLQNCLILQSSFHLIYLKTSAEILKKRIWEQALKPAYFTHQDAETAFYQLYEERTALYEKWSDSTLEMDGLTIVEALHKLIQLTQEKKDGI